MKSYKAQALERLAKDAEILVKDYRRMKKENAAYVGQSEQLLKQDGEDKETIWDLAEAELVDALLGERLHELAEVKTELAVRGKEK